jgi:flagellar capping protein FliD
MQPFFTFIDKWFIQFTAAISVLTFFASCMSFSAELQHISNIMFSVSGVSGSLSFFYYALKQLGFMGNNESRLEEVIIENSRTTNRLLADIGTKLDTMNSTINTKLGMVNTKLDTVSTKLDTVNTALDMTNTKLDTMNDTINTKLDTMGNVLEDMNRILNKSDL